MCNFFHEFRAVFYWDPPREMFSVDLPLLGRPVLWYGFFFAVGFFSAYLLIRFFVQRDLHSDARYYPSDLRSASYFRSLKGGFRLPEGKEFSAEANHYLQERGNQELAHHRLEFDRMHGQGVWTLKQRVLWVVEKLSTYVLVGMLLGAKIGDILFYQGYKQLLRAPWKALMIWEGGLASHGAAAGICLSLYVAARVIKRWNPRFSFLHLLDLIAAPAALAGGWIRVGNFFNQEILGKATSLPWGVYFLHPSNGGAIFARHPVQLYESLFYFAMASFLSYLWLRSEKWRREGGMIGLFFLALFSFRFLIEFFKEKQSAYIGNQALFTMGQWLSIPLIAVGIFLLVRLRRKTKRLFT